MRREAVTLRLMVGWLAVDLVLVTNQNLDLALEESRALEEEERALRERSQ